MKKILSITLVFVLLAGIAVSGTMAYLQDTDSDVNVMTLGNVKIEQHEYERVNDTDKQDELKEFTDNKPLFPAVFEGSSINWAPDDEWVKADDQAWKVVQDNKNVVDKFVTVKNTGKSDAYVRTLIAYEGNEEYGPNGAWIHVVANGTNVTPQIPNNFVCYINVDGVDYTVFEYVYPEALAPEAETIPSLKQVYMNKGADNDVVAQYGETYEILVLSQAVQTEGFADAQTALDTAFGDVTAEKAAEWFKGVGAADTWDGNADTSWYTNDTDTEFVIKTAEQLAGLAELVDGGNTFEGKTIKLEGDLDLSLKDENGERICFEPIGSYKNDTPFKGTFDGQGHTISNMSQNTWTLDNGYYYGDLGLGLFGKVEDATIKNLVMDGASISGESAICGTVAATAYGDCTFENITVKNSEVADYQYYSGGIVGWASGDHQYKNCNIDASTTIAAQWGDFDNSVGGVIGGAGGSATILIKDTTVACRIDAYNDVTSTYQWYAYRRCGMLIGNTGKTVNVDGTTYAAAPQLTCENVTVTYDDWANYTYCEFAGTSWPYVRVQAGVSNSAYSNPRYGHPTDANGNSVVDDTHVHNAGEDHFIECTFDQLYGGGQGVYGDPTHDGVTVIYNNK